ncbi:MAG TPA: CPBP family intramembrane metalloprotease [Anaerolineae bacterium]|nr:CPBP family intramembrane metalloprotease [Anaerolineae bacterium]
MDWLTETALWLNLARGLALFFTGLIAWLSYHSNLLIRQLRIEANLLLSPPETLARLLMVAICLFLAWLSGLPATQLGLTGAEPWSALGWGLGAGLVIQVGLYLATHLAIRRFGRGIYSPWLIRNILPRRPAEWPLVALAFIPPVVMEELLFRTLLLALFEDLMPLPLLILITSLVFGLMHQPQGRLGMLFSGLINVVLGLLFIWSGQLLTTIVAHYTINMLQLVVAHAQQDWLQDY